MRPWFSALVALLILLPAASAFGQARIIGGSDAPLGAYPWMAALVDKGVVPHRGQFCAGVLVGPRWVLTAAHCVATENRNSFDIWIGLHNLQSLSVGVKRKPAAIIRHPQFRADRSDNLFYDVALILLDQPVTGIAPVGLASLPSHNDVGEMVRALGWGNTHPEFSIFPEILQEADLEIVDIAFAQADYQNSLGPYHLAAAIPDFSKDTCAGDSGGPLVRIIDDKPILVGVTSFGENCADPGYEGIYTNVLFFRAWIDGWLALTAVPPAMQALGRGKVIGHGDRTPSRGKGTSFGTVRAGGKPIEKSFRILNGGPGMLIIANSRIRSRFFEFSKEPRTLVMPGGHPKVSVRFDPRRRGRAKAIVKIASNDPQNPLYWFRVSSQAR